MNQEIEKQESSSTSKNTTKLKLSFKWFYSSLKALLLDTLNIRNGADIPGTVESIKRDVEFKGHNIWILILSIFIASIGLNTNSTAVIIGAMLISPLMGPIMGIGLSLGTNNIDLLVIALRNMLIMIIVSVGTSWLYFTLSPFHEAQSEILSRTKPHLLDAAIAIFGGLAGIIGNSRSERSNIVPGVAIATALMPPLCTVGYGLATKHYDYSIGAFYLFTLNSSFICVSAIFLVKVMRFPLVHFINPKNEKRVRLGIIAFSIAILTPSYFLFMTVLGEANFKRQAKSFLKNEMHFKDSYVFQSHINFEPDTISSLEIFVLGEPLDSSKIEDLNFKLERYNLPNTDLIIKQSHDKDSFFEKELESANHTTESVLDQLDNANNTISFQENLIHQIQEENDSLSHNKLPLNDVFEELVILYSDLENISVGNIRSTSDSLQREIPTYLLQWKPTKRKKSHEKEAQTIANYLEVRLDIDSVAVLNY